MASDLCDENIATVSPISGISSSILNPFFRSTLTLPMFALLHAAYSFSDSSAASPDCCFIFVLSSFHHASTTPATASLTSPFPQKSGWIPYPMDGAGISALIPTMPITFRVGSSSCITAKLNCRPRAPDASGVLKVLSMIPASVSWTSLWGIFGQLNRICYFIILSAD